MLRVKLYERGDTEKYKGEILATSSAINTLYESLRGCNSNPYLWQAPNEKNLRLVYNEVQRYGKTKKHYT